MSYRMNNWNYKWADIENRYAVGNNSSPSSSEAGFDNSMRLLIGLAEKNRSQIRL
ncbi:MAG: hypothetical protein ACYSWP_07885 [Planctomycetota bacterium]